MWRPTRVLDVIEERGTSTLPLRVLTDAGYAYLKLPDNPQGPHALACDLIGLRLAKWLGVPSLDACVLRVERLQPPNGAPRAGGMALLTRELEGQTWGGDGEQLVATENPEDVVALVVLDTWTRNIDRYREEGRGEKRCNTENVFFTDGAHPGHLVLVAMDFTDAIRQGRTLSKEKCWVEHRRDSEVYGLFPEFRTFVTLERLRPVVAKLGTFRRADAEVIVDLPQEWDVRSGLQELVVDFLVDRAQFLAERLEEMVADACGWQAHGSSDTMTSEPTEPR